MIAKFLNARMSVMVLLTSVCLSGASGCGVSVASGPEETLVPVSGKIKFDGQYAEGAVVTFTPTGKNTQAHMGTAVTDADGEFEILNYHQKTGLPPGSYIVTVSLVKYPEGAPPVWDDKPPQSAANQLIPVEWNSITRAGRHNTVIVPEDGKKNFEFKIPRKQAAG